MRDMKTALMVIVVVSGSRLAFAQPAAGPVTGEPGHRTIDSDPTESPGFVAIDRFDRSSRAGIELSYLGLQRGILLGDDLALVRFEGHARYVDKGIGLGGYVQLPFAYARASRGDATETLTDVGDLEIGGIFVPRLGLPDVGLVVHAGVTLPTGERGTEAAIGTLANVAAVPEFYNSLPNATTIKLGLSPMFRSGVAFARLDLGLDWNVDADNLTVGKAIHYNAGVGAEVGRAAVMLESVNLSVLDQGAGNTDSGVTLNELAVSARMNAGAISPYFAVVIPLDHDLDGLDVAVTAGAEVRIP